MAHLYHSNPAPIASWTPAGHGWIASNQHVHGGFDINGETLYVGRAVQGGDLIPGKVNPSHGPACYVAWGGQEHTHRDFQVLMTRPGVETVWIATNGNNIPTGAIQGGCTGDGEALFIGRHEHEGSWVIGKVHPSHGCVYVGFDGRENRYEDYEILCAKTVPL